MTPSDVTPLQAFMSFLGPDPDKAAERINLLLRQLEMFFAGRGCRDSEELAEEALARGVSNIAKGAIITTTPGAYFHGIAKNMLKEQGRARKRQRGFVELADIDLSIVRDFSFVAHGLNAAEAVIYVKQCFALLPAADADLLRKYYEDGPRALSMELGLSEGNIRVRVLRIKRRLMKLIKDARG